MIELDLAGRRHEREGIFGVNAAFDGMTTEGNVLLAITKLLTEGHANLFLNDIDAGNHLGHRVFDLNTRIHLDEIKLAVLVEKFEGSRTTVTNLAAGFGTTLANTRNETGRNMRRRCLFDHLLMATLHRAISLTKVNRILVLVGKHLNFNMAWIFEELFHVDRRIAEELPGFLARHGNGVDQRRLGMDDTHATTATTARRLDNDRIADLAGDLDHFLGVFRQGTIRTRHAGNASGLHRVLGGHFIAHQTNCFRTRPDEHEAGSLDALGKIGVLGQETVTRMDGLGVGHFSSRNDGRHIQVALRRRCRADTDGLISQLDVLGLAVGFGVNHHRLDTQFAAGALNPERDLAPVRNQDFFEHFRGLSRSRTAAHQIQPARRCPRESP